MLFLVIAIVALGVVTGICELLSRRHRHATAEGQAQTALPSASGSHAVSASCATCVSTGGTEDNSGKCEQDCMMEAAVKPIDYFDDEELDAYKDRPSDGYTAEETEQFAEVMETLRPEDVRPWGRSLTLRGISLPDSLKDEYAVLAAQ